MCKFRQYSNYEIYSDGSIWSYKYKKFLKPWTKKDGYKQVALYDDEGNKKYYYVHRVVYEAVTSSPIPEGYEINHISEAKDENMISNLELVSHKENCNYGTRNTRMKNTLTNGKLSKKVGAFKNNELVLSFPSLMEAQRNGFNIGNISECCNGKRKTHKGFEWRYL